MSAPDFREALERTLEVAEQMHAETYRARHGADAVLALLAERLGGDEVREVVAQAIFAEHEPGFANIKGTRLADTPKPVPRGCYCRSRRPVRLLRRDPMTAPLEDLQVKAARAVHVQQDRLERSQSLFVILGEPDASIERVAQFMRWADAYQENAVEIAVETVYLESTIPPEQEDPR